MAALPFAVSGCMFPRGLEMAGIRTAVPALKLERVMISGLGPVLL